jgi:hypothetical protein
MAHRWKVCSISYTNTSQNLSASTVASYNPILAEVAPYLVKLDRESVFTDWVIENGWGKHWGVFAVTKADLPTLRRHFRRFLTVHNESGEPLVFRFYDPRVLAVYLTTCNAEELTAIFGPVLSFVLEGQVQDELLRYQTTNGTLSTQKKELEKEN